MANCYCLFICDGTRNDWKKNGPSHYLQPTYHLMSYQGLGTLVLLLLNLPNP